MALGPHPSPAAAPWRLAMGLLFVSYGLFLAAYFEPIPAGADSGGYLNSARLLASGRLREPLRTVPELPLADAGADTYVPLGYVDRGHEGVLTPAYPVGLPLHYALAGKLAGWHWGPLLVGVLAVLAALGGCYLCLRELDVESPLAF